MTASARDRERPAADPTDCHVEFQFLNPCRGLILLADHTIEVQVIVRPWDEWADDPRSGQGSWNACRVGEHAVAARLRMVGISVP